MRRRWLLFVGIGLGVGVALACSTTKPTALETFLRNLTAAECDNQAATIANLPIVLGSPAQAAKLLADACAAQFGTAPAPTPAPGNLPTLPGATEAPAR